MTIHTLRNLITVTGWSLSGKGAAISYTRKDKGDKPLHWIATPIETVQGLSSIASIDEYTISPLMVSYDNFKNIHFLGFANTYNLSQWEALMLAVRHEAEMEEAATMTMLELDEAFKALS